MLCPYQAPVVQIDEIGCNLSMSQFVEPINLEISPETLTEGEQAIRK